MFSSPEELTELVRSALSSSKTFNMAQQGTKRFFAEHTYAKRIQTVLAVANNL